MNEAKVRVERSFPALQAGSEQKSCRLQTLGILLAVARSTRGLEAAILAASNARLNGLLHRSRVAWSCGLIGHGLKLGELFRFPGHACAGDQYHRSDHNCAARQNVAVNFF